jgi:hypothetical protein
LQGASALEKLLSQQKDPRIRVFIVWEPVLPTRVSQYWDKEHLVSRLLGERDRSSVIWDYVAVYQPGKRWDHTPPEPDSSGVPVVRAIDGTRDQIQQSLQAKRPL